MTKIRFFCVEKYSQWKIDVFRVENIRQEKYWVSVSVLVSVSDFKGLGLGRGGLGLDWSGLGLGLGLAWFGLGLGLGLGGWGWDSITDSNIEEMNCHGHFQIGLYWRLSILTSHTDYPQFISFISKLCWDFSNLILLLSSFVRNGYKYGPWHSLIWTGF